jgi:hypothetical protein
MPWGDCALAIRELSKSTKEAVPVVRAVITNIASADTNDDRNDLIVLEQM